VHLFLFVILTNARIRTCTSSPRKYKAALKALKQGGDVSPRGGMSVPLFRPSEEDGGTLEVCAEGRDYLRGIGGVKIAIVSVFGNARAGKSSLLNRVIGLKQGFDVGSDLDSVTIGANFWSIPIIKEDYWIFFLDTEGLGRVGPKYDSAMTLISSLISSNIIFLDSGSIRFDDIRYLHSLLGFINHTQSQLTPQLSLDFIKYPKLTWVINKYCYNDVSNPEEHLLEKLFLTHREDAQDANIIKSVKENFSLRTFFIVPAVENSTLWKSLDTLSEEQLDPRYVSQMNNLKNYLLETKPHSYFSHLPPFTGETLAVQIDDFLHYANEGKGALTENIFTLIQKESKKRLITKANSQLAKLIFPMSDKELNRIQEDIKNSSKEKLKEESLGHFSEEVKDELLIELYQLFTKFNQMNKKATKDELNKLLGDNWFKYDTTPQILESSFKEKKTIILTFPGDTEEKEEMLRLLESSFHSHMYKSKIIGPKLFIIIAIAIIVLFYSRSFWITGLVSLLLFLLQGSNYEIYGTLQMLLSGLGMKVPLLQKIDIASLPGISYIALVLFVAIALFVSFTSRFLKRGKQAAGEVGNKSKNKKK